MIREIELVNFKCFENLKLDCSPLTMLCGMNGVGKSSIIQVMLVLRQSATSRELQSGRLVLGGEITDLGTGQDVLFEGAQSDMIEFLLYSDDIPEPCELKFDYSRTSDELVVANFPFLGRQENSHSPEMAGCTSVWRLHGLCQCREARPSKILQPF